MTLHVFSEISIVDDRSGKCSFCGKRMKRKYKFFQTINPFNLKADQTPKTKDDILVEIRADRAAARLVPVIHVSCEDEARAAARGRSSRRGEGLNVTAPRCGATLGTGKLQVVCILDAHGSQGHVADTGPSMKDSDNGVFTWDSDGGAPAPVRDYLVKAGDDYLVWWEKGTEPGEHAVRFAKLSTDAGREPRWIELDGDRWAWSGMQRTATHFTWQEARDVVWNKLKTCTRDGFGNRHPKPRPDRWAYKLNRIVPRGDTIRPADKKRQ